ncbi:hypothetical protein [uncultured Oscillibacter sp.]|uniref:hypothetical protein n=1 Tax=uncultured Oscillibacter sp. TaxID=876091 RepID=UPI00260DA63B|nr:hypothetical protein [uncultured Oscillibacter sp.]
MSDHKASQRQWGPEDYWRVGPIFVRKRLALLLIIVCSVVVLLVFGLPFRTSNHADRDIPAYRYNDPELAGISDLVQVLDADGQVRYVGEVAAGAYTGRGKVFDTAGELLYDGPLVEGVYEGADAKVYHAGVLVYTGEMAGNLYEGQGRRFAPDTGIVSEGQFSKGFLEGQGQEFYPDGALLREGAFSRDLLEGEGAEYSEEQILLREGIFSAGLLHGDGREYTASGKLRYEGQFWRGIYHGQGALYNTLLGVRSAEGTFVYGRLTGQGTIYHPSGQLLYTGQVCGERPRADAFLGLSLEEVEAAFTTHWLLYSCEGITAFVYPYFNLMFITESPVALISPAQVEEEAQRERQELLDALEQPAPEDAETENDVPEDAEGSSEISDTPTEDESGMDGGGSEKDGAEEITAKMAVTYASAASMEPPPKLYEDETLSPDTDKREIIITQVLSYGQPLPCAAQPESGFISGRHLIGWREWFSDFAAGEAVWDVSVRQSGQFIWRFTPWPLAQAEKYVDELLAEYAGVETMTVGKEDKDMSLWYQTAKWREGP